MMTDKGVARNAGSMDLDWRKKMPWQQISLCVSLPLHDHDKADVMWMRRQDLDVCVCVCV